MTEAHRPQVGEYHYRRALELLGSASPILLANLAWNLKNQGRMAEARALYEESVGARSRISSRPCSAGRAWRRADRNFARAGELLDAAERLAPAIRASSCKRAILHGRVKDLRRRARHLRRDRAPAARRPLGPMEAAEKGRLLDQMGRYDEAFAAFADGKRRLREMSGLAYLADEATRLSPA